MTRIIAAVLLISIFVGGLGLDDAAQLKILTVLIPTISQDFVSNLSPEESQALEQANQEVKELKAKGHTLSDEVETAVIRNYSLTAYEKTVIYEKEFAKVIKGLPENVRSALNKILEDKNSVDLGDMNDESFAKLLVSMADAFKPLTQTEKLSLSLAFPNYATVLKDPKFVKIMVTETEEAQLQLATEYLQNL